VNEDWKNSFNTRSPQNEDYGELIESHLVREALAADPEPPAPDRRQPHLGYAIAFALIAVAITPLVLAAVLGIGIALGQIPRDAARHLLDFPRATVFANLAGTALTVVVGWAIFQAMWHRFFWSVVQWNSSAVRGRAGKLVLIGVSMSLIASAIERLLTLPKDMPIQAFFHSSSTLWMMTFYGVIVAPIFEETLFRGMLLPSLAMAIDWFRRKPVAPEELWKHGLSRRAVAISAVLTSVAFASLHATQLGNAWNAVAVLVCVGLGLAFVRLRYDSLACSVLVHSAYNGSLFLGMFLATSGYRHLDVLNK